MVSSLLLLLSSLCMVMVPIHAFVPSANRANGPTSSSTLKRDIARNNPFETTFRSTTTTTTTLKVYNDEEEKEQIEEARVRIWKSRREEIRGMLKSAEKLRNFRLSNGFVPELDQDGNAIKSDGKSAVTLTAFAVAAGAIVLRVGGRAALISAVGLDFLSDNPDMQNQINQVLSVADGVDPLLKAGLFCLGWTFVKTLCFDAGGVALAFASGILFGGVIQGAVMSAFGATVGSSVAFALYVNKSLFQKYGMFLKGQFSQSFYFHSHSLISPTEPRPIHPSAKRPLKSSKKTPRCEDSKR